ncbi:hypothetical protein DB88DRAFT_496333 [Papiliotrema laurentii]|uniref:Response regulatory domain-containing protein n=1 Tax=Papiliotrema laurentii TaxID=5418 RepID=A0AAD9CWC3_PAPLA|nr:hypothetical protein DB88DRAFT_496333 [Papiliotrema laurentii]
MLGRLARSVPMVTSAAEDGQEALDRFKTFHPDLVLTDVSMPRMDGITAAAHMREFERRTVGGQEGRGGAVENGLGGGKDGNAEENDDDDEEDEDERDDETQARSMIYAITGLGSSDPRLKTDAMVGKARLDGWLIKGQDKLTRIKEIVEQARKRVRLE